jgi:hypothetical protein
MQDLFASVDAALNSGSPAEALDMLAREFHQRGWYDLLFEARGMAKRLELGLPLIQTESSTSFPDDVRPAWEAAVVAAAREAGELHLQAGNIAAGYRYFRAIGDVAPVAAALEKAEPGDDFEDVIAIAFQHGVHPSKGLQLILQRHGICRAITTFGMYGAEKDREQCIALLVSAVHAETATRIMRAIEQQEGAAPPETALPELMNGREWLFGEWDCYVDTSHLTSIIPYCLDVQDPDTLRLLDELCEYGCRLSANFAFSGQPPFENGYVDYGHYVKAVTGADAVPHIRHFYQKAIEAEAEPEAAGTEAAQLLVGLLSRLGRNAEAVEAFSRFLSNENPAYLRCPTAMQLSYAAADYDRMRETARERGDVLSYTAARLLARNSAAITSESP